MKIKHIKSLLSGISISLCIVFLTSFINSNPVQPICIVKPGIGGFVPVNGSPIGNTWNKSQVVPTCRVKPGIGGFVPVNGSAIGNTWRK